MSTEEETRSAVSLCLCLSPCGGGGGGEGEVGGITNSSTSGWSRRRHRRRLLLSVVETLSNSKQPLIDSIGKFKNTRDRRTTLQLNGLI